MEEKINNIYTIRKDELINNLNKDDKNDIKQEINISSENEKKDELNNKYNNSNNSIIIKSLFKAVQENNINEIDSNLIKDNYNINTLNNNGLSLLHLSVIKGNIKIINKLLEYGANPNILSVPNKQTPLHLAYLSQESTKDNIINTLLSYNANDNILDLYDNKPSDYNNKYSKNDLITPDKKNKAKNEDIYYKVNDININFFNTSDVKKKSSIKKDNNTKISKMKCNCIFTPKKNNDNNIESYNFTDSNNVDINMNSMTKKDNKIVNGNIITNNESIKDINIYEEINNNNENIYKEKKNNEDNYNNNLNNSNVIKKEDEVNNINDSLEEEEIKICNNFDNININNDNIDELLKTIITNKRKYIAERSTSKKIKKTNFNTNNLLKNNICININNSNNSCTCISTQGQTSQKKIPNQNNENVVNDKNISEFKYNSLIKSNIKNKKNLDNNNSNSNDNIIIKINKDRIIFKNWLSSINLLIYYDNFLENEIYDINQLINITKTLESKELFKYINSIIKTKKYGHVYRIICKLDVSLNLIDSKLIKFIEPNLKTINKNDNNLSISEEKVVFCTRNKKGKNKEEKNTLQIFLNKYNINELYQNFCHNGFDIIEYVLLQMYSKFPINDFILKNHFHIYNSDDRKNALEALLKETETINEYLSSKDYLLDKKNKGFKYEDFILENKNEIHFLIKNDDDKRCNICSIF